MNILCFVIAFLFTLLDQIIKYIVNKYIVFVSVIPSFFSLEKVYNEGVAFSLFSSSRIFILTFSIVLLVFIYGLRKDFPRFKKYDIVFGILYGGILGNFIDRLFRGYVIDYLAFNLFGYAFPIFNLADIGITLSVLVLMLSLGSRGYNDSRK